MENQKDDIILKFLSKRAKVGKVKYHFLDSGAFTLWTTAHKYYKENRCNRWDFYRTKEFWDYVDKYAAFVKKYRESIDWFANVDAIGNPQLTYRIQKYIEKKHTIKHKKENKKRLFD